MQLCDFLFEELHSRGVRQIFGIPGDFVLNLYEALEKFGKFRLLTLSHEPAVGFAADASARITNGLGVCLVTYGAGGLNMVNSVACAYAEKSPLVVISGGPGTLEKRRGILVHHEVKSYESQWKVYNEVVEYGAVLDNPRTAAAEIRKALDIALKLMRPVYLEVPRDMVFSEISEPENFEALGLKVDDGALAEATEEILDRLIASRHPVLVVGVETHRFGLRHKVVALAERLQIPVTSSFLGRGVFPTTHPQFKGTYLGTVSPAPLREIVEQSDCLLLLGVLVSDVSLGIPADSINESNSILCISRQVYIKHHVFQNVPLDGLVNRLLHSPRLPRRENCLPGWKAGISPEIFEPYTEDEPIRVRHVIHLLNNFVSSHTDFPVVCDTGDCLFASVDIRADVCVGPAYYATMGFAVPGAMGLQAASGLRPLVLVGDGAFQMTGPEIAHCPRHGLNPIVVLFNNSRWEMLQIFFPHARYNETVPWPFARLAELWGGRGFEVQTPRQLRSALEASVAEPRFSLIEVQLERGDVSPILRGFVEGFKRKVYR
ncbi:MAG: indolepyruvate/phenylpyruvate decarboxylase [Acidobacteria bacterium]|nr:indolepyruvate/phenylpyruvate decarboxylase [Acidobacteriota bacterium]MCI0717429.1 indolepyruvate/phenylpyruvate decarboxylase [Acidobacteriota bacterium]